MRNMWLKCHDGRFAVDLGFRFTWLNKKKSSALLLRKGKREEDCVENRRWKSSRRCGPFFLSTTQKFSCCRCSGRPTGRRRLWLSQVSHQVFCNLTLSFLFKGMPFPFHKIYIYNIPAIIIQSQIHKNNLNTLYLHLFHWLMQKKKKKTQDRRPACVFDYNNKLVIVQAPFNNNNNVVRLDSHTFDWVMQRFIHLWLVGLGSIYKVNIIFFFLIWRGNTIHN